MVAAIKPRRGILLVNLGSPDSPSVSDVRNYLNQFLMDPRVLDMPWIKRRLVVSAFILPKRPKHTAEAYQSIWTSEGSPLVVISRRVTESLRARIEIPVALGMTYGKPSIGSALNELIAHGAGVDEIFLVPMFPHYAMSTYEAVVAAVERELKRWQAPVPLNVMPPYFDNEEYIEALVDSARSELDSGYDHLLFSYHGLPERHLRKSDPTKSHCLAASGCCLTPSVAHLTCYRHQVIATTEAFVRRAVIPPAKHSVAFQSRLGRDPWLVPETETRIRALAQSGVERLVVICPSFVSDCLETLEEIGIEGKREFLEHGGREFRLVPCLNDRPDWIDTLARWCGDVGFRRGAARPHDGTSLKVNR